MDNLMLFYPLIVLLFFIFLDVRNRKKRPAPPPQQPADRQTQLPEEWRKRPIRNLYRQQPQPAFKSLRSSRTLAEDVRYGFVMAQILDKPRSLKPYDDSF